MIRYSHKPGKRKAPIPASSLLDIKISFWTVKVKVVNSLVLVTLSCLPLLTIGAGWHCAIRESVISLPGLTTALHTGRSPLTLLTVTSRISMLTNPWPFILGALHNPTVSSACPILSFYAAHTIVLFLCAHWLWKTWADNDVYDNNLASSLCQ